MHNEDNPMRFSDLLRLAVDGSAASETYSPQQRHRIAVALVLMSGVAMAGMMAALKFAADFMSLWQIMALRSGLAAILVFPLFQWAGITVLPAQTAVLRLYAVRVLLAAGGIICWITSIIYLPLGVASAISFSKGFFVRWLAAWMLGETITSLKVITTLVGFIGVLMVLEPGGGGSLGAGALGIIGALFGALLAVVIKRMSNTEPTIRMMFYPLVGIVVLFLGPAVMTWQPMGTAAATVTGVMVVLGILGQWCFVSAYRLGEVSALAPVEYSRLIMAILAGFVFFGEIPTWIAVLGMMLIAAASYAALIYGASKHTASPDSTPETTLKPPDPTP